MTPVWIIDQYILDVSERKDDIIHALEDNDIEYYIRSYDRFKKPDVPEHLSIDNPPVCGIVYGSIQFVEQYTKHTNLIPNSYYDNRHYSVSDYLCRHTPELFLNSDGFFLPYSVLKNNRNYYMQLLGSNSLFIRPNTGKKIFTGCVLKNDSDYVLLEQSSGITDTSMIWVSTAKEIREEYRYVIVNGSVVGGCQYHSNGDIHIEESDDDRCKNLASIIAKEAPEFHNTFVCDVGISSLDNKPYVIEINCINTSGWYMIEPNNIITQLNTAMSDEFIELL